MALTLNLALRGWHIFLMKLADLDSRQFISSPIKPRPIMLNFYTYYAFEQLQCSKNLPIMLNIMPMTTAIMPQFVYDFIIFND